MAPERIDVFILGDVRVHRHGLALQLERIPSLRVIGTGALGDAVKALSSSSADVALLDTLQLELAAVVASLKQVRPLLRIVALGIREVESEVLACAAAGVDGYVPRDADIRDVVRVVESLMRGELLCSPRVAALLYHSVSSLGTDRNISLTDRELQVAELMNRGLSNKEISRRLRIETCTAKNHVQNILQKLRVHRRGQAVAKLRSSIGHRFS